MNCTCIFWPITNSYVQYHISKCKYMCSSLNQIYMDCSVTITSCLWSKLYCLCSSMCKKMIPQLRNSENDPYMTSRYVRCAVDHGRLQKRQVRYSTAPLFQRFASTVKYSNPNPYIIWIAAHRNSGSMSFKETMHSILKKHQLHLSEHYRCKHCVN